MQYITIEKPTQATSKRVENEIRTLAQSGVKSSEIGLIMEFVMGDTTATMNKFKVLKNKVYFSLDKRFNS